MILPNEAVTLLERIASDERDAADTLIGRIASGRARIGVVGLGYVGLPLAVHFATVFETIGFDVDPDRVKTMNNGVSHISDVPSSLLGPLVQDGRFEATTDFAHLEACDCIIVCVPTPLSAAKEPDLSYIVAAGEAIARRLRPVQLIVLESTTYPGTTEHVLLPILQKTRLELDLDFHLAFSPERIDPGNLDFAVTEIPKVVGGCSEKSGAIAAALYARIFEKVHPVSNAGVAEMTKLLENTFRSVNIGLVNEMALLCRRLGIDSREVIDAASTKPFGFMPFSPGPGTGGHCIPLDPLYLSWRAKQFGFSSRFISVADEINSAMPEHVAELAAEGLNEAGKSVRGSRILILGLAYKKNIADLRHSPALAVLDLLHAAGAIVQYHDPFVERIEHERTADIPARTPIARTGEVDRRRTLPIETKLNGRRREDPLTSVDIDDQTLREADCVVVTTAHDSLDYHRIARLARLIVDTRGVVPKNINAKVITL
jgi:UDP-N-acetyl-D-glucosamine dehydrogenase